MKLKIRLTKYQLFNEFDTLKYNFQFFTYKIRIITFYLILDFNSQENKIDDT